MKRLWIWSVWLILLMVACGGQEAEPEDVPAQTAKNWITAVLHQDGNVISQLSCASFDYARPSDMVLNLWYIGLAAKNVAVDPDSLEIDLDFQTTKSTATTAEVRVTGNVVVLPKLRENVLDIPIPLNDEFPIEDTWKIIQEGGVWKWCGTIAPLGQE